MTPEPPDRVHYELALGAPGQGWFRVRSYERIPDDETVAAVLAHVHGRHIRLGLAAPSQLRLTRVETYVVAGPMAVNVILQGERDGT